MIGFGTVLTLLLNLTAKVSVLETKIEPFGVYRDTVDVIRYRQSNALNTLAYLSADNILVRDAINELQVYIWRDPKRTTDWEKKRRELLIH